MTASATTTKGAESDASRDRNPAGSPATNPADRPAIAAFLLGAGGYLLLDGSGWQGAGSALLIPLAKAAPIALLLWLASRWLQGPARGLAVAALGFSALGDVLLALDFPQQFVLGLGAFLVAQLTYAVLFLRRADLRTVRFAARGLPVLLAAGLLAWLLLPAAGGLAGPVTAYLLAIVTMAVTAAAHRGDSGLLYCGALLFLVSDSLIGLNRFVTTIPMAGTLIMVTYYGAQLALLLGLRRVYPGAS